jgi:subtilisin family serine protease
MSISRQLSEKRIDLNSVEVAQRALLDSVKTFAKRRGIDLSDRDILIKHEVILKVDSSKISPAAEDPTYRQEDIQREEPNVEIQIGDPIQQRDPIQQSEPVPPDAAPGGISIAVSTAGGSGAAPAEERAWIIDTGIGPHEHLNVVAKHNFVEYESDIDENGHGTHVAGIIGAGGTYATVGIATGAKLVSVKILDKYGKGEWIDLLAALEFVSRQIKAREVVNISLGRHCAGLYCTASSHYYRLLRRYFRDIRDQGAFVVMSAGNEAGDASENFPGCIDAANVFTVSAISSVSPPVCAFYSNFGNPPVDYVAVGTNVLSTYPGNLYSVMSGTSMAAAVVSGVILARGSAPAKTGVPMVKCVGTDYPVALK